MCKFIGKSNEWIFSKLSKSEILRLYSIVHVAMETTTSNFTCQSKFFISIFFTCQVSPCELQPFSCHDLANEYTPKLPKLCSATLKVSEMSLTILSYMHALCWRAHLVKKSAFLAIIILIFFACALRHFRVMTGYYVTLKYQAKPRTMAGKGFATLKWLDST